MIRSFKRWVFSYQDYTSPVPQEPKLEFARTRRIIEHLRREHKIAGHDVGKAVMLDISVPLPDPAPVARRRY